MSRTIDRAAFALTTDGVVLLNVAMFDGRKRIEDLVRLAVEERGAVFIGVPLRPDEIAYALQETFDAHYELASMCAGTRQAWRRRSIKKEKK